MAEKVIMLGNEAIARGAYEAGVKVSSAYPGTPSTEISEYLVQYKDDVYEEWAPNEKVATEVAVGASLAGVRSMACMKHVGLNVAADPLYSVSYMGVNGGLVLVVADDPGLYSSQNEQDTRMVARAAQIPVIEPSDSAEAKDFFKTAFELSEQFDRPFIFRTTTRLAHSQGIVELCDRAQVEDKPYEKNIPKNVMMPGNAKLRHVEIEKRNLELAEAANTLSLNKMEMNDTKIGVITSGIPYQYVKEALPDASVLKLGLVNPLPKKLIEEFASKVETLYIVEELDPVIEEQVRSWGIPAVGKEIFTVQGEYSANMLRKAILKENPDLKKPAEAPGRPPILCPGCPHRSVFHVLNKLKMHAAGDIGCYTLGAVATETISSEEEDAEDESSDSEEETKESRLTVVSSDSLIDSQLTDNLATLENLDLFMNAVTSNFDDTQNVAIEAKSLEITYNTMKHTGVTGMVAIVGIPALVLLFGFMKWWKRRKA